MKLRCGVVSELWEWWYKNTFVFWEISALQSYQKADFLKGIKTEGVSLGMCTFHKLKTRTSERSLELNSSPWKTNIFFVIWPMKLGSSACRRDGHLPRDSRHCQLVCYNNDSSLSVLILTLTFASLSYSPLAPSLRKTLVILHLFYVPYSSAYYSNRLTEPRALRCRISYL